MISILIAEDQQMLRGALRTLLNMEEDFEVVGDVGNGEEALQFIQQHAPDMALLDIEMPLMTGLDVVEALQKTATKTKILILTTFSKQGYLQDAWGYEVDGYLLKDTPSEELASYIRQVKEGRQVISPQLIPQLAARTKRVLTPREEDVLKLVEKGYSTSQMSEALHLSNGTIRNYMSEIMSKLDAQNRTEAAFIARQNGWLD
ncbi:response regulator transcription factor [Halobacillus litoralis]|uniref:response regulator transcription factor n=1 Tax=Halobacillus litoralis TaxID=45668 RepID=UPI001CD2DE2F|nr:response regulator transcription factor [Halobacillus litoralis]MCA0972328.1 response regulator transcription factor [Halobacillus litoralis]